MRRYSDAALDYVRGYYGVPARVGGRVTVDGDPGQIVGGENQYLLVEFDEGYEAPAHPTWRVRYQIGRAHV